ncbi:MAG: methylenetetrahydrofolate reductase C-terminal domain-containing protein [Rhodospirillales bacterium]
MLQLRRWSARNPAALERVYDSLAAALAGLDPLFRRIGYRRLEGPIKAVERRAKRLLFGCRMCGQCILRLSGMTCPMNCPKKMRNGPCGGVRPDGGCESRPRTRCAWVEAWEGSRRMINGGGMAIVKDPINQEYWGGSSWLRVARGDLRGIEEHGDINGVDGKTGK